MPDHSWLSQLAIPEVLVRYEELRLLPSKDGAVTLSGALEFTASTSGSPTVTDRYEISIHVPKQYPSELPVVRETNCRIPRDFHKLRGNALCLGSPFRLWLLIGRNPSLLNFIERVVIPYLYGYSLHEGGALMPFGELKHGSEGLIDDIAEVLGSRSLDNTGAYLQAVNSKKRVANKRACPCGGGVRLGRCHNRQINNLRSALRLFRRRSISH